MNWSYCWISRQLFESFCNSLADCAEGDFKFSPTVCSTSNLTHSQFQIPLIEGNPKKRWVIGGKSQKLNFRKFQKLNFRKLSKLVVYVFSNLEKYIFQIFLERKNLRSRNENFPTLTCVASTGCIPYTITVFSNIYYSLRFGRLNLQVCVSLMKPNFHVVIE